MNFNLIDGLNAAGAFGIIMLVLDKYLQNLNPQQITSDIPAFKIKDVIENYWHIFIELFGIWFLAAKIVNVIIYSELLAGFTSELISKWLLYAVTITILLPLSQNSFRIMRAMYVVNNRTLNRKNAMYICIFVALFSLTQDNKILLLWVISLLKIILSLVYPKTEKSFNRLFELLIVLVLVKYLIPNFFN